MGWIEDRMPHWRLVVIAALLGLGVIVPLVIMVADLVSCGQPPSEAVIRRAIATAIIDRRINPAPGLMTPLPQCDRACSDQLAIEISAIDGCHHATKPYLPASEPVEEYWDITVDVREKLGQVQRTGRFWAEPKGWAIYPLNSGPFIIVDEFGAQRAYVDIQ